MVQGLTQSQMELKETAGELKNQGRTCWLAHPTPDPFALCLPMGRWEKLSTSFLDSFAAWRGQVTMLWPLRYRSKSSGETRAFLIKGKRHG